MGLEQKFSAEISPSKNEVKLILSRIGEPDFLGPIQGVSRPAESAPNLGL
jgi:hypothetical protein